MAAPHPMAEEWRERALCAEVGTDLFYSNGKGSNVLRLAMRVCRRCPVTAECLDFALAHMETDWDIGHWGVWAGTTAEDRRRMLGQSSWDELRPERAA